MVTGRGTQLHPVGAEEGQSGESWVLLKPTVGCLTHSPGHQTVVFLTNMHYSLCEAKWPLDIFSSSEERTLLSLATASLCVLDTQCGHLLPR